MNSTGRSAASFAPPPAVSKEPEAEKAAAAASAAPAVENRTQEIRFEQAYEEISRNVRSIYEEAPDDTRTVAREQPEVATQQTPAADVPPAPARRPKNDVGGPCARTGVWAALPRQPGAIPHGLRCSGP